MNSGRMSASIGHAGGNAVGEVRVAEADDVGDAVDQHRGLAAPRAGKDEQGAVDRDHRLPLFVVQFFGEHLVEQPPFRRKVPLSEFRIHSAVSSFRVFPLIIPYPPSFDKGEKKKTSKKTGR